MDAVKSLNGEMWIFAVLLIGVVLLQAAWFMKIALDHNKKHNYFSKEDIGHILKMGSVSVIGPALSCCVVAIALIAVVGSGLTFMRVGVIGAAGYEMMIANLVAETLGVTFSAEEFTAATLVLCGFGMAFASIPYFIATPIELYLFDKTASKTTGEKKKKSFFPYLGKGAMMGLMGTFLPGYFNSIPSIIAFFTAALLVYGLVKFSVKRGKRGIMDWCVTLAMLAGMTAAQIVATLMA